MGAWETALVGIAAVIAAINQGLRDAPHISARFPRVRIPGWINYLPLVLLIGALALYAAHRSSGTSAGLKPIEARSLSTVPMRDRWLSRDFPVERAWYLAARTSPDARRLKEPFVGASATIQGYVGNAYGIEGGLVAISLQRSRKQTFDVELVFEKQAADRALRLQRNDPLYVSCVFRGAASPIKIRFEACRLLPQ